MIVEESIFLGKEKEKFVLTNARAMFWPKEQALILSDIHLGKSAHFRQHGLAIPQEIAEHDLERLAQLIHHFHPKSIIIVGDFFHAGANREIQLFNNWKSNFPKLQFRLIRGNHDRLNTQFYEELGFDCYNEWRKNSVRFTHDPEKNCELDCFTIAGHIHPGVQLVGKGRQKLRLPCYLVQQSHLVLPAFSKFTGLNTQFGKAKDYKAYCITSTAIFAL